MQQPDCGYTLEYVIEVKDTILNTYSPLPSFIQYDGSLGFDVFSKDETIQGDYQISIIGKVPTQYMDPVYSEELLIEL